MHSNWLKIEWVKNFSFLWSTIIQYYSVRRGHPHECRKYYYVGGQGSVTNHAGELTALPRTRSWWGLLPATQEVTTPSRSWPLASIFGTVPTVFIPPQCVFVRVLIKTLLVPIFGAKEFIRIHHFVLKYTKKYPGVATPRQGRNQGEGGRAPLRKLSALRWFWDWQWVRKSVSTDYLGL